MDNTTKVLNFLACLIIVALCIFGTLFFGDVITKSFDEPDTPVAGTVLSIRETCIDTMKVWEWRKGATVVLTLPRDSVPYHVAKGVTCDKWPYMFDFNTGTTVP